MPLAKRVAADLRRTWHRLPAGAVLASLLTFSAPAYAEESHPGISVEPLYSEAVIAYNKKSPDEALRILNTLLKQDPKHLDALQLKALTLKSKGDDVQAIDTYERLIRLKPAKETGPYHFELGVIHNRQKRPELAEKHFKNAIKLETNVTASHLFLGISKFSAGKLNEAEEHFDAVSSDSDPELKMIGYYYLGLLNLKNGNGSIGLGQLVEARSHGSNLKDNPSAKNITASTEGMLSPFDKGQWFLTANLLPQYDSNVAMTPVVGPAPTGSASLKFNGSAAGGWMSSAMSTWQWVGSLRGTTNFNTNTATTGYQYATMTPTLFVTRKPLARMPHGLKVEYNYTLQCTQGADGSYAYRPLTPFAHSLDIGPFLKWVPSTRTQLQFDLGLRRSYYPTTADYSGLTQYARLSGKFETGSRLLNPGITVSLENNDLSSSTTTYLAPSISASNSLRLDANKLLYVDLTLSEYAYHRIGRYDGNLAIHPTYTWNFKRHWSVLADLSYTINTSNDGNYSYNRWTAGVGMSWSLN